MTNHLTAYEIADRAGCSVSTVYLALRRPTTDPRHLPSTKFAGRWQVAQVDALHWIARRESGDMPRAGAQPIGEIARRSAALILGVSRQTVTIWLKSGKLKSPLTIRGCIECALHDGKCLLHPLTGHTARYYTPTGLGADGYHVGLHGYGDDLEQALKAMTAIAALVEWRVVKD